MYKTKKSRIPAVYRILLVAIAVMAIGGIAVNVMWEIIIVQIQLLRLQSIQTERFLLP